MKSGNDAQNARQETPPALPGAESMTLRDVAVALRARLWLLALCLAGTCALAAYYVVSTPFLYRADMAILLDPRERVPVGMEAQAMPQSPDPALIESHMRMLTSRSVLRDVVENEKLLSDSDFAWRPGLLSRLRGGAVKPQDAVDRAADALSRAVSVKRAEKSYMVDVGVLSSSPDKAERLAQAVFHAYSQSQRKLLDTLAGQQTAWLDERAKDLHARLMRAEEKARAFRQAGGFLMTEGKVIPESQLRDANTALVAARGKRADAESRLDQIQAAIRLGRADALGEALRSTVIDKLRADYAALAREEASSRNILGPRHPAYVATESQMRAIDQQIAAELRRIAGAAERELKSARKAEDSAEKFVASLQSQTNDLGGRRTELEQLEREVATVRAAYEKAMNNRENVRRDVVAAPFGFLADAPSASRNPTQPRIVPAVIVALGAGFNFWVAIVVFQTVRQRWKMAPGVKTSFVRDSRPPELPAPGSAPHAPSPPFTASLPFMEWARRRAPRGVVPAEWPKSGSTLRYAAIVADLLARIGKMRRPQPMAVAVVSQDFYTGKSTFAHALAEAAAQAGERVVLLDLGGSRAVAPVSPSGLVRESCGARNLAQRIDAGGAGLFVVDAGAFLECERQLAAVPLSGLIVVDSEEAIEALALHLEETGFPHPVIAEIATPDLLVARRA